jgi:hypothetical protein
MRTMRVMRTSLKYVQGVHFIVLLRVTGGVCVLSVISNYLFDYCTGCCLIVRILVSLFCAPESLALSYFNHSVYVFIIRFIFVLTFCMFCFLFCGLSQWPRGLRRRSAAERLLGSWVQIPRGGMDICLVECLCCQVEVSATGRSFVQRSPTDCGVCLSVIK